MFLIEVGTENKSGRGRLTLFKRVPRYGFDI